MKKPITILYIITLPELGGAQSHVLELIKGFRLEADIHLATSAQGPLTEMAASLGATIHILPSLARSINPLGDLRSVRECLQLIRELKPALVHLHSSKAGLVGRIAAKMARVPAVFTAHGWGFKPGVPLSRRCLVWLTEALSTHLAVYIICVSEYDTQLARRYLPGHNHRFITIRNGLASTAELATACKDEVTIMMTARFQEPKEQQLLLRAVAALKRTDFQLVFVGGGRDLSLSQKLSQELGIAAQVQFLGDRTDIPALLSQSQIFVLLSRYEGLPISILEAMRAGLPVVASQVGGVPEEVDPGVTGFLVPSGDIQAVASSLNVLINDASLRRKLGEAGRQKFLQGFTTERMLSQTKEVYERVLRAHLKDQHYRFTSNPLH